VGGNQKPKDKKKKKKKIDKMQQEQQQHVSLLCQQCYSFFSSSFRGLILI
jgi:hypothetical protein